MTEPTVTLRFPRRLHQEASIAATRAGKSLQEFVGNVVEQALAGKQPQQPGMFAGEIAELSTAQQEVLKHFLEWLVLAPDSQIRLVDRFTTGTLPMLRELRG